MADIVDAYSDAVYNNLRPLHANWEPGQPIELGAYGILSGHAFQRLGNVSQLSINIGAVIDDDVGDQKIFTSGNNTTVSFHAGGEVPATPAGQVKASVEVSFGSESSAFFNAAGCSYSLIADKTALGKAIMAAYDAEQWERNWAVVTDLIRAKSTTVAISTGANASITLEATGTVTQIDLANASIGLALRTSTNVGYQVISQAGHAPLIGLSQIQTTFLGWNPKFKPLTASLLRSPAVMNTLLASRAVETEPRENLYFGQVF